VTSSAVNHPSKVKVWLLQMRAPFVTASIVPVLVGTSAGFAVAGSFNLALFMLALFAIICLQLGANLANEYFDHLSGNDRLNKNRNPFSGGSGLIQQGLTSPRTVLIAAWLAFALTATAGMVMLLITKSAFILALGLIGIFGQPANIPYHLDQRISRSPSRRRSEQKDISRAVWPRRRR